ncbi:MAG: DUF2017 family protein [Gaiellaceae bacterium]
MVGARIHRTARGELALRLPEEERTLLRRIAADTRARLRDDDPALRRLFPPAYEDAEREREYRELTRGQLAAGREQALELLQQTVDNPGLSPEEADSWLRALNDVRLVLGTELDVTEDLDWDALDPDDQRLPALAVYAYVSWIQEQLVEALG